MSAFAAWQWHIFEKNKIKKNQGKSYFDMFVFTQGPIDALMNINVIVSFRF